MDEATSRAMLHHWPMLVSRFLRSIAVLLCWLAAAPLSAEEPARAFLDGLRARGYHDAALDYLKGLETSRLAPDGFREIIPYERALTLIESARKQRDLEVRVQQLNEAQNLLKQFVDAQASHPKAFAARSQLGNLIVERARIKVEQAKSGNTQKLMKEVRQLYEQAFKEFSELGAAVTEELDQIPKVLDTRDRKEAALAERRTQLRADNLQTELLAAAIREETADMVPAGSKEQIAYLTEAAELYDGIYKKYRSRLAGLYARMYQGRCNQRLGKTKDALGYYGELLDQPDQPEEFRKLKTETLRLAMECWLAPNEQKYFEAIKQASNWLAVAPRSTEREPDMLAIRLSLARAYKMQADDFERRGINDQRTINLSIDAALKHAEFVANEPGELQEEAKKMVLSLGGRNRSAEQSEPTNFTQAQQEGKKALDAIGPATTELAKLQQQLQRASQSERATLEAEVEQAKAKVASSESAAMEYYRLALELADRNTPPSDVNLVRYFVCYLYYIQQQYHEAALVGEFVARRYPQSAAARECVKIALACYRKLLEASTGDTSFEIERLVDLAQYTSDTWPGSPEALMASVTLVPVLVNAAEFDHARDLTLLIPESNPARGEAELVTGQAMWGKHLQLEQQIQIWQRDGIPEGTDLEAMQGRSDDLAANATSLLADGYARLPEQPVVNTSNATALLSLAQSYVSSGDYSKAVEVLEHPVIGPVTLIQANDEAVSNPLFIEETHRTSLQAYVGSLGSGGAAMMEKAKTAMTSLQQAVGSDAAGKQRMLGIYVNLAHSVQQQMMSASLAAKQEMSSVFEAFLQELSGGSSDIGVLNWVAETFASLGAGFDDNEQVLNDDARKYYERSIAAFQNLLSVSQLDPKLATQIRVRMAAVKASMHQFQDALNDLQQVLAQNPSAINVQVEAAQILQRWARSDPSKYRDAISGIQGSPVWGWGQIAGKTQQYKQFRDVFYQARYRMAECQFELAQTQQGEERTKRLAAARRSITQTKQLYPTLGGDKWTQLYDELLTRIGP